MRSFSLVFALFLLSPVSHAAPVWIGGPEKTKNTTFECVPPASVSRFNEELKNGTLENTVNWQVLTQATPLEKPRLIFQQQLGYEYLGGSLVYIDHDVRALRMNLLTAPPATANMLRAAAKESGGRRSARGPSDLPEYAQILLDLSADYNLFAGLELQVNGHSGGVFAPLFNEGTMVFTRDDHAIVLSMDFSAMSICVKSEEDAASGAKAGIPPEADHKLFKASELANFLYRFFQNVSVRNFFSCEEFLE